MSEQSLLYSEATIIGCGFEYHHLTQDQVVQWADRWIEEQSDPCLELVELSMMGGAKPIDVLGVLYQLGYDSFSPGAIEARFGFLGLMRREEELSVSSSVDRLIKILYDYDLTEDQKDAICSIDLNYSMTLYGGEKPVADVVEQLDQFFAPHIKTLRNQLASIYP